FGYLAVARVAFTPILAFGARGCLYSVVTALGGASTGALLCTVLVCIKACYSKWPKWLRLEPELPTRRGFAGALVVAILFAIVSLFVFYVPRSSLLPGGLSSNLLWYERTIGFSNGVTVAVPFIFIWLAIYL